MSELTVQRAIEIAIQHQQAGRTAEAENLFRQMQDVVGDNAIALHGLGKKAQDASLRDTAMRLYRLAAALPPGMGEAHNSIGLLLRAEAKEAEALEAFQRAIAAEPKNLEYLYNVSWSLRALARTDQAIEIARRMIALSPTFSAGYFELGRALQERGQVSEAIENYLRAVQFQPNLAPAWHLLGVALWMERPGDHALRALTRAATLNPGDFQFQVSLAQALFELRQLQSAADALAKAIELKPDDPDPYTRMGNVLLDASQHDRALASFQRAIALQPADVPAIYGLARTLHDLGEVNEALALHEKCLELTRDSPAQQVNFLLAMHLSDAISPEELLNEHQRWAARYADPLASHIPVHENDRSPDRTLQIGYVSPDLYDHPVAHFLLPILQGHDRRQFDVTCYSNSRLDDGMTARLRTAARSWRIVPGWTDERLAKQIIEDRIDILIDLAQHSHGNRILLFARKPAPVQITYLGYPGTTGLKTFDAKIGDPYIDPPGETERFYTEPIERLPETYWCFTPIADAPPIAPPPATVARRITFGCLNKLAKSSPSAIRTWAALLKGLPGSRLLLSAPHSAHRKRILDIFASEGVHPARIELIAKQPFRDYLALYQRIDIALDPFPYNGGTTTCQALWMGVPVVTLAGAAGLQRSGASLLSSAGLPELVATTREQYIQIATELAGDLPRLSAMRQGMRKRMVASPLMNVPRFVGNLEAIYRKLWRKWCEES